MLAHPSTESITPGPVVLGSARRKRRALLGRGLCPAAKDHRHGATGAVGGNPKEGENLLVG